MGQFRNACEMIQGFDVQVTLESTRLAVPVGRKHVSCKLGGI